MELPQPPNRLIASGTSGASSKLPPRPTNGHAKPMSLEVIRTAADLVSRNQLATRAGITFGGDRDLFSALGYRTNLTPADYRSRYKRGNIAARIVEAYPKSTWRGGAEVIEDADPDVRTPFEDAWQELSDRLNIWTVLMRADILAGLGPFSLVLLGAPGPLEQELPRLRGADDLLYLAVYGPDEVTVTKSEDNAEDPRFGLPVMYTVNRAGTSVTANRRVHWTRTIHVADGILDDRVNGSPMLERVWNLLDDLFKVVGGGSEAFWLRVHGGMALSIDKDLDVDEAMLTRFRNEAEEFAHNMRRILAARGFTVDRLGGDVADFSKQVSAIISLIAGATGIPQRILLGSERGQLASGQDKASWDERVQDRRIEVAAPLVRTLIDRLVEHNALPKPQQYEIVWPEIQDLDEQGKAAVADTLAGLNKKAGGTVITPAEIRDRVLGLDALQEDDDLSAVTADTADEGDEVVVEEPEDADADDERPPVQAKRKTPCGCTK